MRTPIAVATLLLLAAPAWAEPPLTVGQCYGVYQGLVALERRVVVDDKGLSRIEPTGFKFGAAVWAMSSNLTALQRVVDTIEKARLRLNVEIAGGNDIKPNSRENAAFDDRMREMLDKPCDVTPARLKRDDLRVGDGKDQNAIPASVLSQIAPIIDEK